MQKAHLTRRGFLRLSVIAAGSVIASACQKALTDATAVATSTVSLSPTPYPKLDLGGNRDVWAWIKPAKVSISDGQCERVILDINGREFEAQQDSDSFTAELTLAEGENQISAICVQTDGAEVRSEPVIYTGRLRQVPTAVIETSVEAGQIILDGSRSLPAEATNSPIVDYGWSARPGNPAHVKLKEGAWTGEPSISIIPPAVDGEYYMHLEVKDQAGGKDLCTSYFLVENGQARVPDYDHENPAWVETAIVYGVVPFLFGNPAFSALREHLDELAELGINALWLGPINIHPADDYGYAVEDYFGLDPAYGTEEDFRVLVLAAHRHGIRVLMDFVPNHTSDTHPYFKDAQRRGPESPYWDFYDRDAEGNYTHYFQWTNLPNLNYDHPEVRRMMIEAFSKWVREFDVDGFRVDVAWGIRERYPEFWPEWRRALKRIKPDLLLLAEATAREPFYFDNGFDAAYDWTYQPGGWAWKIMWDTYKLRLLSYNLTDALMNRPEGFHPDALIFRFLNNNDTGERFITRHGEDITRVATAMLLTLPGIPCIYTGDEYGLAFEPYQQLEPLTFKEQYPGLREYHKRLIALRKEIPSLHSRLFSIVKPDPVPQTIFGYLRYGKSSDPPVLVLLNFSEEPAEFTFDVPEELSALSGSRSLYDLLAAEDFPAFENGRMRISVPAFTARVLTGEPVA